MIRVVLLLRIKIDLKPWLRKLFRSSRKQCSQKYALVIVNVRSTADPALESAMSSKMASPRSSNPTVVVPTTLVSAVELVTVTSHLGMMTVFFLYPS